MQGQIRIKIVVGSPSRVKHHVVVQYMVRWMKCPLPPGPPGPQAPTTPLTKVNEDKEESTTLAARDFALQLP